MNDLPFRIERSVVLPATPNELWNFVAGSEGWAGWWGEGSWIDPQPGGAMHVAYPNGQSAQGNVLEVDYARRIQFTWGYDRPDAEILVGESIVTIELTTVEGGALLTLHHDMKDENARDLHVPGWRYALGLLRSLVAKSAFATSLASNIDAWHEAWSMEDERERLTRLTELLVPDVVVSEAAALTTGIDDLNSFISQSRMYLPGTVSRSSAPALNGESATWDWQIVMSTMTVEGRSMVSLALDGKFRSITSFWLSAPQGVPVSTV